MVLNNRCDNEKFKDRSNKQRGSEPERQTGQSKERPSEQQGQSLLGNTIQCEEIGFAAWDPEASKPGWYSKSSPLETRHWRFPRLNIKDMDVQGKEDPSPLLNFTTASSHQNVNVGSLPSCVKSRTQSTDSPPSNTSQCPKLQRGKIQLLLELLTDFSLLPLYTYLCASLYPWP